MAVKPIVYNVILVIGIALLSIFYHTIFYCVSQYIRSGNVVQTVTVKSTVTAASVWCHLVDGVLQCSFKNLCYIPKEKQFIFILSTDSIISGIGTVEEMKSIHLSSVQNHNLFKMNIAVIPSTDNIVKRTTFSYESVFLMWRFKWDNIMHVIHDDILPLYFTYGSICAGNIDACISKYRLAFVDGGEIGVFGEWYKMFSSTDPLLLHKEQSNNLICFNEAHTGLLGISTWFQYGFGMPQGPIKMPQVHGNMLKQFTDFILTKYGLSRQHNIRNDDTVLVFSRKLNRQIVNEDYLTKEIVDIYKHIFPDRLKVRTISMDISANKTTGILLALVNSKVVVGMHGSAMILCLFLQPGSTVIELFPFGIDPQHVSPIKALSELPGVGIIYKSWVNTNEENSYTHPEAPPLLGGILHLSHAEQEHIKNIKSVPPVECCHNTAYLYRMFQDTFIDSSFVSVLKEALLEQFKFSLTLYNEQYNNSLFLQYYYPSPVSNILCKLQHNMLNIVWAPPINQGSNQITYIVAVVSDIGLQLSQETKKPELSIPLTSSTAQQIHVDVWIKSVVNEKESMDVHEEFQVNVF